MNVGFLIDEVCGDAADVEGCRTTVQLHEVAPCGDVSSCAGVPVATELALVVARSIVCVSFPTRRAWFPQSAMYNVSPVESAAMPMGLLN